MITKVRKNFAIEIKSILKDVNIFFSNVKQATKEKRIDVGYTFLSLKLHCHFSLVMSQHVHKCISFSEELLFYIIKALKQ